MRRSLLLPALLTAAIAAPLAIAQTTPATTPPGLKAGAGNPNLAVSQVKLDNGVRVSTLVGATVYGSDGKELGKVDDLVMTGDDKVTLAVVAAGGFLGLGAKLVAFPYTALKHDGDRLTLPDVTPDTLKAMPSLEY